MKTAIDIRNMHSAIHELYIVNKKPMTTINLFRNLHNPPAFITDSDYEFYVNAVMRRIEENTEYFKEINYRYISGGNMTRKGIPLDDCIYDDGTNKFKIIARFDLYI